MATDSNDSISFCSCHCHLGLSCHRSKLRFLGNKRQKGNEIRLTLDLCDLLSFVLCIRDPLPWTLCLSLPRDQGCFKQTACWIVWQWQVETPFMVAEVGLTLMSFVNFGHRKSNLCRAVKAVRAWTSLSSSIYYLTCFICHMCNTMNSFGDGLKAYDFSPQGYNIIEKTVHEQS